MAMIYRRHLCIIQHAKKGLCTILHTRKDSLVRYFEQGPASQLQARFNIRNQGGQPIFHSPASTDNRNCRTEFGQWFWLSRAKRCIYNVGAGKKFALFLLEILVHLIFVIILMWQWCPHRGNLMSDWHFGSELCPGVRLMSLHIVHSLI